MMRRYCNLLVGKFFKSSYHSLVPGNTSLEKDVVAYSAIFHHLVQVVAHNRIGQPGDQIIFPGTRSLVGYKVGLHEDSAAFTTAHRTLSAQRLVAEFSIDVDLQFLSLFLQE